MNDPDKNEITWMCPDCGVLLRNAYMMSADMYAVCPRCGANESAFTRFELDKGDEITTEFEKRLAALTKHGVYDMGYDDGCAASAYGGDELDAAYRRGHNDGCAESAQLRAIEDTINTMCSGGESSTPATPDDIEEAYDNEYTNGAFNAYPDGYNTEYDKGYQDSELPSYINRARRSNVEAIWR